MLEAWFSWVRTSACAFAMLGLIASSALVSLSPSEALAETRTLKLFNTHTKERVSITFKKNGRYVSSGLRELNRFLRDWRRNEITKMDPKLFDLVWEVYQKAGTNKPIHVVSGYRSPATNNMLRSRSRGVAKKSQHTRGRAMDFFIPGVNVSKLRAIGLRKEVGGVGYYPTSRTPFVHMDTGSVRHWPRMTRRQLAKVFPRGDTIHIPTDGKKMPRYAEALARHKGGGARRKTVLASASGTRARIRTTGQDITSGNGSISRPAPVAASGSGGPSLIARLFGGGDDAKDTATPRPATRTARAEAAAPPPVPSEAPPGVRSAAAPDVIPPAKAEPAVRPEADPVIVAKVVPPSKPNGFAAIVAAATDGTVRPGTLEAQAQRLARGEAALPAPTARPLVVASAEAAPAAARMASAFPGALPRPAPPQDGVSAIAAVTGSSAPARKPESGLAGATLAYAASAGAVAPADSKVAVPPRRAAPMGAATGARPASLSGRVPAPVIKDPLAKFAAMPNRDMPHLMSADVTTRTRGFAALSHPNQRRLGLLLAPGGRIFANRFGTRIAATPKADRFEGPAVVLLPVLTVQ